MRLLHTTAVQSSYKLNVFKTLTRKGLQNMQIPIEDIKVKRRIRNKPEELEPLMESMKRYGLLNPVTLNGDYVLLAGQRRLEAAKRLGWHTIKANIIETPDKISALEIEIEENTMRSDFTDEELMAAYARLEKLRNPNWFIRLCRLVADFFKTIWHLIIGRK